MKEELKQKMIGVIGTHSNGLIESIAEKCAQVAIDHYKERESALSMSGVSESDIDLIFTLKSESEASEQQPLHRIMAYNSRQIDRREGAKLLLKLMNHPR